MSKPPSFTPRPPSRPLPSATPPPSNYPPTNRPPTSPSPSRASPGPPASNKPATGASSSTTPPEQTPHPTVTPPVVSRQLDKDLTLPTNLDLPENELYSKSRETEQKLDDYLMAASARIQRLVSRPNRGFSTSLRILRFTISNSHEGQPVVDGATVRRAESTPKEPSWSIRLSGRLLDPQGNVVSGPGVRKMSSFFKTIVVQLDRAEFPTQWNITWNRSRGSDDVDTFTFTNKSSKESIANVYLTPASHPTMPDRVSPTPALREALSLTLPSYTRQELLVIMWRYIRENNLQSAVRKSNVECNQVLQGLLDVDHFEYGELLELLQPHILTADPIHIAYPIRFCKDPKDSEIVYDIPVDVDAAPLPSLNFNAHQARIADGNKYISEHIYRLHGKKRKRDFYLDYSIDPLFFIHDWTESQARDHTTLARPPPSLQRNPQHPHTAAANSGPTSSAVDTDPSRTSSFFFNQPHLRAGVEAYLFSRPHRQPQNVPFVDNHEMKQE